MLLVPFRQEIGLLFFLKIFIFNKMTRKLEESFRIGLWAQNVLNLLKLVISILFMAHIIACIWVYEARVLPDEPNWLIYKDSQDQHW